MSAKVLVIGLNADISVEQARRFKEQAELIAGCEVLVVAGCSALAVIEQEVGTE